MRPCVLRYAPSLSKYDQSAQWKPKHVCMPQSLTTLAMLIQWPACAHPIYHLLWQWAAPDRGDRCTTGGVDHRLGWRREGGGGGSRCSSIQLQPVGKVTVWRHTPGLMSQPPLLPFSARFLGCCLSICAAPAKPIIHARFKSKCHMLTN